MKNWIILLFLMITINLMAPEYSREIKFQTYFDYYKIRKVELASSEFSMEKLEEYLLLRNASNRRIIFFQAVLETGSFTSVIFEENNNLFGMKLPRVRQTTAIDENRGHAVYNNWVDSVDDYILWYNYVTRNRDYKDYLQFLVYIGYAEDPYYLKKLLILKET